MDNLRFGTIVCVENTQGILHFEGLQTSVDAGLLPTKEQVNLLCTGCDCFCYDSAKVYKYEETTDRWYEIGGGGK